jgi:hypothetical protein
LANLVSDCATFIVFLKNFFRQRRYCCCHIGCQWLRGSGLPKYNLTAPTTLLFL